MSDVGGASFSVLDEEHTLLVPRGQDDVVGDLLHDRPTSPGGSMLDAEAAAALTTQDTLYIYDEIELEEEEKRFYFQEGNETRFVVNCSSPFDNVQLSDPRVFGSLVPLGLICLMVIFGNLMVIAAVRMTRKLRGATNLFIVSLAWADLMLGMVVLPFSAMYEVFSIWVFGDIWCSIWLAVDVWTCTASILHLVVISLDRYIAVTHPITYPNIMTSKRAKLLILGCWIASFIICFPPLVGWKEKDAGNGDDADLAANATEAAAAAAAVPDDVADLLDAETQQILDRCMPQCSLIQEPGYVIYSAVGSFFAPMFVMMFFNWKIYRTATKTTKAIRQGFTKVKGVCGSGGDDEIRINRGGGGGTAAAAAVAAMAMSTASGTANNGRAAHAASLRVKSGVGGGSQSVTAPSSRRPSNALAVAVAAGGGPLRRQQTLAATPESRTLPRSNANGRIKTSVTCNGLAAASARSAAADLGAGGGCGGGCGGGGGGGGGRAGKRKLSASTNSLLHVPDFHELRRGRSSETLSPSSSSSASRRRGHAPLASSERRSSASSPSVNYVKTANGGSCSIVTLTLTTSNGRPRVSQHQPCPNHIMGKTFAEQGTQTQRPDKRPLKVETKPAGHARLKPFRWRTQKSSREDPLSQPGQAGQPGQPGQPGSPCSLDEGRRQPRLACFRFRRWKQGLRGGAGGPGPAGDDLMPHITYGFGQHGSASGSGSAATTPSRLHGSSTKLTASAVAAAAAASGSGGLTPAAAAAATKLGKRNIKSQVRRFRMETKAAKTLGIIVGCFICCWFPFFTMYLFTAFCTDCVPALVFSIIFWLGYCNSAINPFIYAMFSREFRNAFKKILCKFLCNRTPPPEGGALARMGLPFAPQTVAIGLADRFPAAAFPLPGAPPVSTTVVSAANDNLSTTSSNRTSIRKNSLRP